MKVTGKIINILEEQSGTSGSGKDWKKISFVVDNNEQYNNIYCFEVFGVDKVDNFKKYNKKGQLVNVEFNVSCNEWKGKYFTTLSAWKISAEQQAQVDNSVTTPPIEAQIQDGVEDLPF